MSATETSLNGRIAWTVATLTDPRVAAHLDQAADKASRWRSKIIVENYSRKKSILRPHRAADGRFFVRTGYRGGGRLYLADKCEIVLIDGDPSIFRFYVEGTQR